MRIMLKIKKEEEEQKASANFQRKTEQEAIKIRNGAIEKVKKIHDLQSDKKSH